MTTTTTANFRQDPLYDLCRRAHEGTSFVPEVRGESYVKEFRALERKLCEQIEDEEVRERFRKGLTAKFTAWMHAKSNCMSTMITGGANFPAARNQKRFASERKRSEEYYDYANNVLPKILSRIEKQRKAAEGITELTEAREKLAKEKAAQEMMLAVNKLTRKKSTKVEDLIAAGLPAAAAEEAMTHERPFTYFESYQLSNLRARIKNTEQRVRDLESREQRASKVNKSIDVNGVEVIFNFEADRIQIKHQGKPDAATITKLKKAAFKWSPNQGVWQRQLTVNAIWSTSNMLACDNRTLLALLK